MNSKLPLKVNDRGDVILIKSFNKYLIEKIMKLADLHDMLNSILDKVNRCYSMQVN